MSFPFKVNFSFVTSTECECSSLCDILPTGEGVTQIEETSINFSEIQVKYFDFHRHQSRVFILPRTETLEMGDVYRALGESGLSVVCFSPLICNDCISIDTVIFLPPSDGVVPDVVFCHDRRGSLHSRVAYNHCVVLMLIALKCGTLVPSHLPLVVTSVGPFRRQEVIDSVCSIINTTPQESVYIKNQPVVILTGHSSSYAVTNLLEEECFEHKEIAIVFPVLEVGDVVQLDMRGQRRDIFTAQATVSNLSPRDGLFLYSCRGADFPFIAHELSCFKVVPL